mgnify:CR=1 FL=1|jgi:hypothetical protein|tara:strand:+ start:1259 stop:1669 length:411 start_codon:yes stop_codon:yes gene_type:complete
MSIYTKPKCPKNTTLIKSRCECKKTNNKTAHKKTKKKTKKTKKTNKKGADKYQEHWALVPGQYSLRTPTKAQLKVRRRRINEVYKVYEKISKLDKKSTILRPSEWAYPPEYCYNEQLQHTLKNIKLELKALERMII